MTDVQELYETGLIVEFPNLPSIHVARSQDEGSSVALEWEEEGIIVVYIVLLVGVLNQDEVAPRVP